MINLHVITTIIRVAGNAAGNITIINIDIDISIIFNQKKSYFQRPPDNSIAPDGFWYVSSLGTGPPRARRFLTPDMGWGWSEPIPGSNRRSPKGCRGVQQSATNGMIRHQRVHFPLCHDVCSLLPRKECSACPTLEECGAVSFDCGRVLCLRVTNKRESGFGKASDRSTARMGFWVEVWWVG